MKRILITGSTDGIGKLAAIQLAKEGHVLYLHGRTEEKLTKTIEEVKKASSNNNIEGFIADFSKLEEVKKMVDAVNTQCLSLDVLINNAGVFKAASPKTTSGQDIRFVVNYLAPMILTNGLLPLLKVNKEARIINLSSAAQEAVSLDALSGKVSLSDQRAYAQSKLALTMWSMHLAQEEENLIVIPVNPGSLLNTKMVQEAFGRHWSSADKGAAILTSLAIDNKHLTQSGVYFDNDLGSYGKAHEDAYNNVKIDALLKQTTMLIGGF